MESLRSRIALKSFWNLEPTGASARAESDDRVGG
jgi:hypothetical protein